MKPHEAFGHRVGLPRLLVLGSEPLDVEPRLISVELWHYSHLPCTIAQSPDVRELVAAGEVAFVVLPGLLVRDGYDALFFDDAHSPHLVAGAIRHWCASIPRLLCEFGWLASDLVPQLLQCVSHRMIAHGVQVAPLLELGQFLPYHHLVPAVISVSQRL